jgi:K+-sensing histidine kinase KdpD
MSPEITAALVKRHTHELRNCLNGVEMSLTLLDETHDETQRRETIRKIRQEMRSAEAMIRLFSGRFSSENKSQFLAADMIEQWMVDARSLLPETPITWDVLVGESVLEIEASLLRSVLGELTLLSARKGYSPSLGISCRVANGTLDITIASSRTSAETHAGDASEQALRTWLKDFALRNGGALEWSKGDIKLTLRSVAAS